MSDSGYLAKYIHIFYGHDLKFSGKLIMAFNENNNEINPADHLFVLLYSNLYEEMRHFENVILDDSGSNLFIKYGNKCKWLISHGLPPKIQLFLTPRSTRKKIICRYWGGAKITHSTYNKGKYFYNFKVFVKRLMFRTAMESFAAIGIANSVDIIDLSRLIRNGRYYRLPYAYRNSGRRVLAEILESDTNKKNSKTNILLGHRGTRGNNHIEILQKLKRFDNEAIQIYIPLSYGNEQYIEKVRKYIESENFDNVTVISDFLSFKDYAALLHTMDIGIFDGQASYALGNISSLLYFRKTIFLRKDGVISRTFDYEGIPYKSIEEIDDMTLADFISPVTYVENDSEMLSRDVDKAKRNWDIFFAEFN